MMNAIMLHFEECMLIVCAPEKFIWLMRFNARCNRSCELSWPQTVPLIWSNWIINRIVPFKWLDTADRILDRVLDFQTIKMLQKLSVLIRNDQQLWCTVLPLTQSHTHVCVLSFVAHFHMHRIECGQNKRYAVSFYVHILFLLFTKRQ